MTTATRSSSSEVPTTRTNPRAEIGPEGYRYLNSGAGWETIAPGNLAGLVIDRDSGALRLSSLPGDVQAFGPALPGAAEPLSASPGMAVDLEGNVYIADAVRHVIWRVDGCDGRSAPLTCVGGEGSEPGQLREPAGLAVTSEGWLVIADGANHRLQVVDLSSQQLRAIVGQGDPTGVPRPGDDPGKFDRPAGLAVAADGRIYVSERGNRRVQQFDRRFQVVPSFAETLAAQPRVPAEPAYLAIIPAGDSERLAVVDASSGEVLVFTLAGVLDADLTARLRIPGVVVTALAGTRDAVYLGDVDGRVHVIAADGARSVIRPFPAAGPVLALVVDCHGRLLARQGSGEPVRLTPDSAYGRCGTFLAGPLDGGPLPAEWQRVTAEASLGASGHVQFFALASNQPAPPALPAECGAAAPAALVPGRGERVPLDTWRAAPAGTLDFLALTDRGRYLWVAGILEADGTESPSIAQLQVTFNSGSWMRFLPATYTRGDADPSFGVPAMLLLESELAGLEAVIDQLPLLFDPRTASTDGAPDSWLDWLAGWVGIDLQEEWDEPKRRRAVAEAFAAHRRRGTVEGLVETIRLYTGANVHIAEPGALGSIWSLGETSTLAATTVLAVAHADGAVVGVTATPGQSHLIREDEYGAPLFEEVAHRFCVSAYAVDLAGVEAPQRMRSIIDREKPAHTTYDLCTIDALLRVGFQAQVGVDTIVGDVPGTFVPGGEGLLGFGTVLPPPPSHAAVGQSTALRHAITLA